MKRILVLFATLAVAACMTTTEQAEKSMRSKWIGRNADAFFSQHGLPSASYTKSDGNKIYEWKNVSGVTMPGVARTTITPGFGGASVATTTFNPPVDIPVGCKVSIETSNKNIIRSIRALGDTIGMWEMSRCNEIFGG